MTYVLGQPETLPGFADFKALLMTASFHNADDSGDDWGLARQAIAKAAKIANDRKWHFYQIEQAHKHINPLVAFDQIMQAILEDARTTKGE